MSVTNRYWRLISTDPKAAKRVILAPRPQLSVEYQEVMSDEFLYNMLEEMGTIAAVNRVAIRFFPFSGFFKNSLTVAVKSWSWTEGFSS